MMETEYSPKANEIMKHESTLAANSDDLQEKEISLEDCMSKFFSNEKL